MKDKLHEDDPMLDTNQMAELTGLKPMTLYHWMEQGKLPWPFHQVAPTKRVSRRSDVLAWLETVKVPAGVALPVNKSREVMPVA